MVTSGNVEASQIGGDRGIHSQMWKGNIAEILIFDKAVSGTNRYLINHYLSKKWGLQANVDSDGDGHPDSVEIAKSKSPTDPNSKPSEKVTKRYSFGSGSTGRGTKTVHTIDVKGSGNRIPTNIFFSASSKDQNWGNRCSYSYAYLYDNSGENIGGVSVRAPRSSSYRTDSNSADLTTDKAMKELRIVLRAFWPGCATYLSSGYVDITFEE